MKTDCIRFLRHWNLMLSTNHRTKLFLYHLLTFQLEVLYTDVNIKIKNMNTSIKNILASWESSLIRFQKIDCWNYSENLATLGWYLHNNNCTIEEYYLIKYVRDSIIGVNFNVKSVLNAIQKLMNMETAKEKDFTFSPTLYFLASCCMYFKFTFKNASLSSTISTSNNISFPLSL